MKIVEMWIKIAERGRVDKDSEKRRIYKYSGKRDGR